MRTAAAVIALFCCVFEGSRRSGMLKERVKILSELMLMLNNFSIEIRCSGLTLDELMSRERGGFAERFRQARKSCADARAAWESACGGLPEKYEETALLQELGRLLGTSDKAGQLRLLELYLEQISRLKESAESSYAKKGKAYFQVGVLCGIAAAILII